MPCPTTSFPIMGCSVSPYPTSPVLTIPHLALPCVPCFFSHLAAARLTPPCLARAVSGRGQPAARLAEGRTQPRHPPGGEPGGAAASGEGRRLERAHCRRGDVERRALRGRLGPCLGVAASRESRIRGHLRACSNGWGVAPRRRARAGACRGRAGARRRTECGWRACARTHYGGPGALDVAMQNPLQRLVFQGGPGVAGP